LTAPNLDAAITGHETVGEPFVIAVVQSPCVTAVMSDSTDPCKPRRRLRQLTADSTVQCPIGRRPSATSLRCLGCSFARVPVAGACTEEHGRSSAVNEAEMTTSTELRSLPPRLVGRTGFSESDGRLCKLTAGQKAPRSPTSPCPPRPQQDEPDADACATPASPSRSAAIEASGSDGATHPLPSFPPQSDPLGPGRRLLRPESDWSVPVLVLCLFSQ
jgi:hypothetical protein